MKKAKKLLLLIVILLICMTAYLWQVKYHPNFTSEKWKNTTPENRLCLAKSFVAKQYRDGMSVSELKKLLGEPDIVLGPNMIAYIIGLNMIDYIVISFDVSDSGITSNAHIFTTS